MKRGIQWALLGGMGVCFVAIATAGVWGAPTRGFREGWGCEPERIGITIGEPADGGGSADEVAAIRDLLPNLAADGQVPLAQLEDAVTHRTGPSRFDPASGELYIDDLIHADIGVSQLEDGTWVALNYEHCMRPPESG